MIFLFKITFYDMLKYSNYILTAINEPNHLERNKKRRENPDCNRLIQSFQLAQMQRLDRLPAPDPPLAVIALRKSSTSCSLTGCELYQRLDTALKI